MSSLRSWLRAQTTTWEEASHRRSVNPPAVLSAYHGDLPHAWVAVRGVQIRCLKDQSKQLL